MAKTTDPLIKIAKELAALSYEDQARTIAISQEFRVLASVVPQNTRTEAATLAPVKRKGRKPGSKNKKKGLDETFPKDVKQDSGVAQ